MGEVGIELPPIQPDLLSLIHRTHQQADANGQQLNVGQRYPDVAGYHQSFIQDPVENIEQVGRS